jgi:hypothetical protein
MPAAALPLTNDLRLEQGAVFAMNLRLEQPKGVAYNLTGKTLRASIKNDYTDAAPVVSFTCAVTLPATDGLAVISLTAVQTAALAAGDYVWDLLVDSGAGVVNRLLEGPVQITARVTT